MTDYVQLTPTTRLAVMVDNDAQCPRGDWHMLTGFVNIEGRGDSRRSDVPAVHEDPTGRITEAYEHFQPLPGWGWQDAVARWAKIFHGLVVEYDSEHGGFWFAAGADEATAKTAVDDYSRALFYDNFPELVIGTPEHLAKQAEVIRGDQETYRQWADNEVEGVVLQRSVAWAKLSADGSTVLQGEGTVREEWEDADSLWGIYGLNEHGYTPIVIALENFELTDEEEAAAQAMS